MRVIIHKRTCRERGPLRRELHIKVKHEGVHVLLKVDFQCELALVQIGLLLCDCPHVERLHRARLRHDVVPRHVVAVRLPDGLLGHGRHVEPVDVAPPVDLVLLVRLVLDPQHKELCKVGDYDAPLGKPLVAGVDHAGDQAGVDDEGPHPLAEDDVDRVDRKVDLLDFSADEGDALFHPVGGHDLAGLVEDG